MGNRGIPASRPASARRQVILNDGDDSVDGGVPSFHVRQFVEENVPQFRAAEARQKILRQQKPQPEHAIQSGEAISSTLKSSILRRVPVSTWHSSNNWRAPIEQLAGLHACAAENTRSARSSEPKESPQPAAHKVSPVQ